MSADAERWDRDLDERASPAPLLQSWAWGEVQARAGWSTERIQLSPEGAMASVQLRKVGPAREAYVPRGPVPATAESLDQLVAWAKANGLAKSVVEPADWLSGDHRIDGVFAAAGPTVDRAALADGPFQLVDLAPTILAAAGAPASVAHSGTVLTAVVGEDAARRAGQAAPAAGREGERLAAGLNESEAEEVEEHLRGLGYLE